MLPAAWANSAFAEELTRIPPGALPGAVDTLIHRGRELEAGHQWAEALSHYEEALREHPTDTALQGRYDFAKLHYSLDRRYADASYVQSIDTLQPLKAHEVYSEVLLKLQSHYVTIPTWKELVVRGVRALDIALADADFLARNKLSNVDSARLDALRGELYRVAQRYAVRSRRDAAAVAGAVARHAQARVGLAPTATYLEFAAAAAGGLDNYSAFLTPGQLKDVFSQIEGNFVGMGVELKAVDGGLLIVNVIPRSPAKRAGIRPGDQIVEVDGQPTTDLTTDQAAALLTGAEGSVANLTAVTPGEPPRRLSVRREHVEVPSIESAKIVDADKGIAYVRLPTFQKTTGRDLDAALWNLYHQGMRSLILDLRGNPGGLLTASVEAADKFIENGGIVSTRGRNPLEDFNYTAHREGTWRVPLIVLIDGDSASASEIFAGAIRDSRRGTIVGDRSYGKGSVQGIFPLGTAGVGLRLTTAKFYSPSGRAISKVGVNPDIVVRHAAKTPADSDATPGLVAAPEEDAALEAAVQVARRQLAAR